MKINRILASLLAVTVVGANMPAVSVNFPKISLTANAAEAASPLKYETLEDGKIEITGCDSTVTTVEIPAEIDGKKVTSIGKWAFGYCSSSLTSIKIPDSVTSIGNYAFQGCSGLTSITIPDSVTSIGNCAFWWCDGLRSITISNSVTSIGNCTFFGCSSLRLITIPDGVTSIGDSAFFGCSGLTSITIPASVMSIGGGAFQCVNLKSLTILNSNCELGDDIFYGADSIDGSNARFTGTLYGYSGSTAQEHAEKYGYKFESLGEAPATKVIAGDANCDGKVSIADSTAILQHLGNQDKYGLSAEGLQNADVDENDGVSTNDALVIQMVDAKLLTVEQLPLKK